MTNKLIIDNFLIMKHAEINITRYTIFVGPQTSGKSVVAKLLYIFYHLPDFVYETATSGNKQRKLNESIKKTFCEIFPQYAWNEDEFCITFKTDFGEISFSHKPNKVLNLSFSNQYKKIIQKVFTNSFKGLDINSFLSDRIDRRMFEDQINRLEKIGKLIHELDWGFINGAGNSLFIPAGRSFFSSLENNVFSFISKNIHIDYFLKEFGMIYQNSKNRLNTFSKDEITSKFSELCKKFIRGTYLSKQQKDYIKHIKSGREIEVKDASSGQQELLPLLFVVFFNNVNYLLIEEIETHIFPSSQHEIVKYIISTRKNSSNQKSLLFTTHSPYVLTTINNLAYAGYLENKFANQKDKLEKLDKIYSPKERIPYGELSAYMFKDGNADSIIDDETLLICAEELDSASDVTGNAFSEMLKLEMMEQ